MKRKMKCVGLRRQGWWIRTRRARGKGGYAPEIVIDRDSKTATPLLASEVIWCLLAPVLTHIHAGKQANPPKHAHACTQARTPTRMRVHTYPRTYTHTHMHAHMLTNRYTDACTRA